MENKNRVDLKYRPNKCWECGGKLVELQSFDPNGVPIRHWHCTKCGEEIVDMEQLHESAMIYRELRKSHVATISKWGNALALRIPKEIVVSQKIKPGEKFRIQKEKNGFRAILEK